MIAALVLVIAFTLTLTYSLSAQHIYRRDFPHPAIQNYTSSLGNESQSKAQARAQQSANRSLYSVDPAQVQALLRLYQPEVLFAAQNNLVQVENRLFKVRLARKELRLREVEPCALSSLLDVFELAQNPVLSAQALLPELSPSAQLSLSVTPPPPERASAKSDSQVLIVYTTCNQLPMTILSLQFLRNTDKLADLLIVDDHSTDGTVEYLRKRGFAVITKPRATGLTDSWNIGYRLAVALGYKNVVFTNNDVLLTTGSVALMYQGLRDYALVVPLTTEKGAGHHPAQSIMRAYKLPPAMMSYTDDYRHAELIQETILKKFIFVPPEKRRCPAQYSKAKGLPKFNGFCFSVNVEKISPAAYERDIHLFDPTDVIVGQEDHLVQRMHTHKLMPIILHCAFVYHFKSVTVSSANFTAFVELLRTHSVSVKQVGKSPIAQLSYFSPEKNATLTRRVDIREDLRWYHPEEQADFVADLLNLTRPASASQTHSHTLALADSVSLAQRECTLSAEQAALFPRVTPSVPSRLQRVYRDFPAMSWNIRTSAACVYPAEWAPHCGKLLNSGASLFEPELHAVSITPNNAVVIAIAMSDPVTNPSAGDVFTAYELGNALTTLFSHVRVRYLARGTQWYSPEQLSDVDVLITLLDDYDLSRALSLFQDPSPPAYPQNTEFQCTRSQQIKPNLVTIAWARNWFHRWLTKPWIGNYDALLTSSSLAKAFFDTVAEKHGLAVSCSISCPRMLPGYAQRSLASKYLPQRHTQTPTEATAKKESDPWRFFTARASVQVSVLPIATAITGSAAQNDSRGSRSSTRRALPSQSTIRQYNASNGLSHAQEARRLFEGVDFLFSGSYFNVYRRVMDFDPDALPAFEGRIVGGNWHKANVSRGWLAICTGLLPYEIVKESYQYVKVVIDDANHVTAPWGSVNSRVFDALAAGSFVLSNGAIGLNELFGAALREHGLPLPLFSSGQDLAAQLRFYLTNDDVRLRTAAVMREVVLKDHSYLRRAEQLVDLLETQFSFKFSRRTDAQRERFKEKQRRKSGHRALLSDEGENELSNEVERESGEETDREVLVEADRRFAAALPPSHRALSVPAAKAKKPRPSREGERVAEHSLCVGVRTAHKQSDWLPVLLKSLIVQHRNSPFRDRLTLQLFLVDTEAHGEYTRSLMELADELNEKFSAPYVQVMVGSRTSSQQERDSLAGSSAHSNKVYGYDDTDRLLTYFLNRAQCPLTHDPLSPRQRASTSSCEWLMFTNGDNMYNSAWFSTVAPKIFATKNETVTRVVKDARSGLPRNVTENVTQNAFDIIGWDFITHHPRGVNNDTPNQPIHIALERKFVDLGSVLLRSSLFIQSNTRFLQEASLTTDLFARDFFTIKRLLPFTHPDRVHLIHQCLLLHQ